MAQFSESLCFDLSDAFASHSEMLAYLLKRVFGSSGAQSEAHLDHFFFAWCQRSQYFIRNLSQV